MSTANRQPSHQSPSQPVTDAELIASVIDGSHVAFNLLLERYRGVVLATIWSKLPRDVDAEDILQDTFVSAYRHLPRLRDRSRFGPWVVTIARRQLADSLKARSARAREIPNTDALQNDTLPASASRAGATPESREFREVVRECIGALSERYRLVVSLRLLEEMTVVEIAGNLAISENTARVRLHRGLGKLRKLLHRRGFTASQ